MFEQFSRFMNTYFLIIAVLQLWPDITPVNPAATWIPLAFIFLLSSTKEALDDIYRWRSDNSFNNREYAVVRNNDKKRIAAKNIRVGDILFLQENDEIPCDLVLLTTSDPTGVCYIETANIDGESEYKQRQAIPQLIGRLPGEIYKLRGIVECPPPSAEIYRFESRIQLEGDANYIALNSKQELLQATTLRNTEWVYGVVVYTGNETKFGQNKKAPTTKWTNVDRLTNRLTIFVFIFQVVFVICLGFVGDVIYKNYDAKNLWYLYYNGEEKIWWTYLVIPLRYLLVGSIMIPISLKVTIDIVKTCYAIFINWDAQMYDYRTKTFAFAASTAISEDLAQIKYLFTDKTGTLTENKMVFVKCFIGDTLYGHNVESSNAFKDPALLDRIKDGNGTVHQFMKIMAACNTVIPAPTVSGEIAFKASSPDEKALVEAAARFGFVLSRRDPHHMEVSIQPQTIERLDILHVLEFDSDRKQMSVLVREKSTGQIRLYTKGADDSVLHKVKSEQNVDNIRSAIDQFASLGLRTLCIGVRDIPDEEYKEWSTEYATTLSSSLENRDLMKSQLYSRMERDITVLGATGIEDKLQDQVPETIHSLKQAGIKIWMLTGDKWATALQIATSCNLMASEPQGRLIPVLGLGAENVRQSILAGLKTAQECYKDRKISTVIIEGRNLTFALENYKDAFADLGMMADAVICCRVTPAQKAAVVKLIKDRQQLTLAIGDGGNDVSMILEANVGVGIRGFEGLQAARAADYVIGQFKFVRRLLLCHGRYSYLRTSFVTQYSFYKSIFLCLIQFLFAFSSDFSGATFFNTFALTFYNMVFTSLPPVLYVLDKDLSEASLLRYPELYRETQMSLKGLNIFSFSGWFMRAALQAIIVIWMVLSIFESWTSYIDGNGMDHESLGMITFTIAIIVQATTIILESHHLTWINYLGLGITLVSFFALCTVWSVADPLWTLYDVMIRLYREPTFWLSVIVISVAAIIPVLILKYVGYNFLPSQSQTVRALELREKYAQRKRATLRIPLEDRNSKVEDLTKSNVIMDKALFSATVDPSLEGTESLLFASRSEDNGSKRYSLNTPLLLEEGNE